MTVKFIADTLPKDLLEAIGDMVVRWGRLQWQLSNLIIIGFDIPKDTGRALVSSMSINSLCEAVRIMTLTDRWIKDADLRKDILSLSEEIKNKSNSRNNFVRNIGDVGSYDALIGDAIHARHNAL